MPEYGLSLTRISPYEGRMEDSVSENPCGSVKTHILAYFTQFIDLSI